MNWIELKALHELYHKGEVRMNETLAESEVFSYLCDSLGVVERTTRKARTLDGFRVIYEKEFLSPFIRYHDFLQDNALLKPQSRFEENDLKLLITLKEGIDNGDLVPVRDQIVAAEESLRGVSQMFFKNEKYLLNKPSVVEALKQILQIEQFANERDQQYIYKLECRDPQAIVLCENLDFLTKPSKPRQYRIELWYAGGKNIAKLHFADTRGLPIYYSCDWDYDGLLIYTWVKDILPQIQLLHPSAAAKSILETEHHSLWKQSHKPALLSTLPLELFDVRQQQLIETLIRDNCWIIEESNNLIEMIVSMGFELSIP